MEVNIGTKALDPIDTCLTMYMSCECKCKCINAKNWNKSTKLCLIGAKV